MKLAFSISKYLFLPVFLCLELTLFAQETFLKGVISIQNSQIKTGKKLFVRNAQVEDESGHAQPVITDDSGRFVLIYVGVRDGITVHLTVKKPLSNLDVVNLSSLTAITGQKDMVRIAMAPLQQISEYRKQLYKVGITSAERRLRKVLNEKTEELTLLRKSNSKDSLKMGQLTESIRMLKAERQVIDSNAIEFAKIYSQINLDDASSYVRNAIIAYQNGNIDSALNILENANLKFRVNEILSQRNDIKILREEINKKDSIERQRSFDLSSGLALQARLFRANLQFDSAAKFFELRARLEPENGYVVFDYAEALDNLHQYKKSLKTYLLALSVFQSDSANWEKNEAKTFLNIGSNYQNLFYYDSAEIYYKKAKQLYLNLEKQDSIFKGHLAAVQLNLAALYQILGNTIKAKNEIESSIKILTSNHSIKARTGYILVGSLETYATINVLTKDTVEAEKNHRQAVKIMEELIKANPRKNVDVLASLYSNLGNFYFNKGELNESEKWFMKSLATYTKLEKEYPSTYSPNVALELQYIGAMLSRTNFLKAKKFLDSSLHLYETLAKGDRETYEPAIANVDYIISHIYFEKNNFEAGEKYFSLSEKIVKKYEKSDSSYFILSAEHNKEIGSFYYNAKKYKDANVKLGRALILYKKFASYQVEEINIEIYNLLSLLGSSYLNSKNLLEAKKNLVEATVLNDSLSQESQKKYYKKKGENYYLLALAFDSLADYNSAIVYYKKALNIFDSLFRIHNQDTFFFKKIDIEMGLARSFLLTKNYSQAKNFYKKSLENAERVELAEPLLKLKILANIKLGLAQVYFQLQNPDTSKLYLIETLQMLTKTSNLESNFDLLIVNAETNLGNIYFFEKNYKKAETNYQYAKLLLRKYMSKNPFLYSENSADVEMKLTLLYEQVKDRESAIKMLEESLKTYQKLNLNKKNAFSNNINFINEELTYLKTHSLN